MGHNMAVSFFETVVLQVHPVGKIRLDLAEICFLSVFGGLSGIWCDKVRQEEGEELIGGIRGVNRPFPHSR